MHALRAQAESRVDEVAVCWFYQPYDMPRCCTNTSTTRKDQTESKTARKRWGNKEHKRQIIKTQKLYKDLYVQLVGQGRYKRPKGWKRQKSPKQRVDVRAPLATDILSINDSTFAEQWITWKYIHQCSDSSTSACDCF